MGINFLDTAACYGISEELIGRTVANRRDEYVLVTKAGHARGGGLNGSDWSYETVRRLDRSQSAPFEHRLRRIWCNSIPVVFLTLRGETSFGLWKMPATPGRLA